MSPEKWSFPTDAFLYTRLNEIIDLFHKVSLVEVFFFFFFTEVLSMEIFENTVPFQRGSSIFTDAEYLASSTFSGLNIEFLKMGCFLPEAIIVFAVVSMRNLLRPLISSPYGLFGFQRHRIPCCSCLNLIITGQKCGHFVVSMQSW